MYELCKSFTGLYNAGNHRLFIFTVINRSTPGKTGSIKDCYINLKMVTKDFLRIVLFVLFAAFAIWSGYRNKVRDSVQLNKAEETKETETQQLMQHP